METFAYLTFWLFAAILAAILGYLAHYAQAHLQAYPDKLFDGEGVVDELLNLTLSPDYRMDGRYTLEGWWDYDSNRNLAICMLPPLGLVVVGAIYFWADRGAFLGDVCTYAYTVGIEPRMCLWLGHEVPAAVRG